MFIRATGNISPQKTFGNIPFLNDVVETAGNRLQCIEPDYKLSIDVKWIRRMSRIIRMGVAAAMECLREAGVSKPGAIITGTAYGCMEDTGIFMKKLVENKEELLTPTPFIQSTHNTIGSQIALMLSCNAYNNTFVHRGFSFETALLDALLLLKEQEAPHVLVGAADEITGYSHAILERFGMYKRSLPSSRDLYKDNSRGTIAGEGASFFLLSPQPSGNDYAVLEDMTTCYKPANTEAVQQFIRRFLEKNQTRVEDLDLVIDGRNGDAEQDMVYKELAGTTFKNIALLNFKHLCGEYPTATSFALWSAANILKNQAVPAAFGGQVKAGKKIKKILIYNHYQEVHHSLFLIAAC